MRSIEEPWRGCVVLQAPALAPYRSIELSPGEDVQTDAQIEAFLRQAVKSAHHPVGTCAMGGDGDPDAVLDSKLRVRGVSGLRVCDASAMPTMTTSNPNATVIAMAESCAKMINLEADASRRFW